jgi:pilus assembly protein CpaF
MENSVWKLLSDLSLKKGVSEVIINSTDNVYIEKNSILIRLNVELKEQDLYEFCEQVAVQNNLKFGPENPIIDGTLQDGSRINVISSQYTGTTPAITIRKYLKNIQTFDELDGKFLLTAKWIHFFKNIVAAKSNIIISGGTAMGKTTFMNLLLNEVSPMERIITLEDTKELSFESHNSVRLFSSAQKSGIEKPLQMRDLVKNTLRMRPDRIIVGEVRGAEVFDLLQAMNTGHEGSMCTVHANSALEALSRLENLFLLAGFDVPQKAIRSQISDGVDFIIQLNRNSSGERIVSEVLELTGMQQNTISSQSIGKLGQNNIEFTGIVPDKCSDNIP